MYYSNSRVSLNFFSATLVEKVSDYPLRNYTGA